MSAARKCVVCGVDCISGIVCSSYCMYKRDLHYLYTELPEHWTISRKTLEKVIQKRLTYKVIPQPPDIQKVSSQSPPEP